MAMTLRYGVPFVRGTIGDQPLTCMLLANIAEEQEEEEVIHTPLHLRQAKAADQTTTFWQPI